MPQTWFTRATNWKECWNAKSVHNQPSKLKKVTSYRQKNPSRTIPTTYVGCCCNIADCLFAQYWLSHCPPLTVENPFVWSIIVQIDPTLSDNNFLSPVCVASAVDPYLCSLSSLSLSNLVRQQFPTFCLLSEFAAAVGPCPGFNPPAGSLWLW